jgi:hypothetical protein
MISLIAYQKHIDAVTTHTLKLPEAPQGAQAAQELATLPDGRTVVALFDGHTLPADQPAAIAASIEQLPSPLPDLLREQIKAASPMVRLIGQRMIEQIRSNYTIDDEMYFARIGVGAATGLYTPTPDEMHAMTVFGEFVESVRAWGRAERAKLGL